MGVIQEIDFAVSQASANAVIAEAERVGSDMGSRLTQGLENETQAVQAVMAAVGRQMQDEFEEARLRIQAQFSAGLIDADAVGTQMTAAANAAKENAITALEGLRQQGILTADQFTQMSGRLADIQMTAPAVQGAKDEVEGLGRSAEKVGGGFDKLMSKARNWLIAIAGVAAIKRFLDDAFGSFMEGEQAALRLDAALKRTGTSAEALAGNIQQVRDQNTRLRVQETETDQILATLVGRTGQVAESFKNVGVVVNLARRENMSFAEASQVVANLMNGNVMRLKQLGIESTNAKDAMEELRRETEGAGEAFADSFSGKVMAVANEWSQFKEAIGGALAEAGGGTSIVDSLGTGLRRMREWVQENGHTIRAWGEMVGDAVRVVANIFGWLFARIPAWSAQWERGTASMRRDFQTKVVQGVREGVGELIAAFGRLISTVTFGRLGQGIKELGDDMIQNAARARQRIEQEYQETITKIDRRMQRTPGGGRREPGTLPGLTGEEYRNREKDAAAAKAAADAAKKAAEDAARAYEDTVSAALRAIEMRGEEAEAVRVLEFAQQGYRRMLEDTNLTYARRIEILGRVLEIEDALAKARMPKGEEAERIRMERERANQAMVLESIGPVLEGIAHRGRMVGSEVLRERTVFDVWNSQLREWEETAEETAGRVADHMSEAFDQMRRDGLTVNSVLGNLAKGMARSVLGELQRMAKGEAMAQLAEAIKQTAYGFAAVARGDGRAAVHFKAAGTHYLSAAKWGLVAGSIGAAAGGGAGGASAAGGGADRADTTRGGRGELHIHLDGVDPKNPRHQILIGETQREYEEVTGGKLIVHSGVRP